MKKWLAISFLLLILGCAPTVTHMREPGMENFGQVSKSLTIGKTSEKDIYKKFGIPTTKTYFSSGTEQWKYFYNRKWRSTLHSHLGTYGWMDKQLCFIFNPEGILIEFSYEETPEGVEEEKK